MHISAAFSKHITVIYNKDNLPDYIYREYGPWKSPHKKLMFDKNKNLNFQILNSLN